MKYKNMMKIKNRQDYKTDIHLFKAKLLYVVNEKTSVSLVVTF